MFLNVRAYGWTPRAPGCQNRIQLKNMVFLRGVKPELISSTIIKPIRATVLILSANV